MSQSIYISPKTKKTGGTLDNIIRGETIELNIVAQHSDESVDNDATSTWKIFTKEGTDLTSNDFANLANGVVANSILFISADSITNIGTYYLEIKTVFSSTNKPIGISRYEFNVNL